MDIKILNIGHVDYSRTTLSSALLKVISEQENKIIATNRESERERGITLSSVKSYPITNPYIQEPVYVFKLKWTFPKRVFC
jgi:translation elongation factor EF-Tu-like GTPase